MDFHLKQWRDHQQQQDESDSVKLPTLHLDHHQHQISTDNSSSSPALTLFSPEPTHTKLSAFPPDSSPTKMGGGYFSMGQWQELELQALIYRHMLTGTAIPPELLHLLLKKSLINSPSPSSYYQFSHPYQHYPHFQPAMMQSGYWGRGAMDPEPGRCRRTDGKKWRCSRDIVAGHKYCERHVHRGRNRSRKPVEVPTPTTITTTDEIPMTCRGGGGNGGGEALKTANGTRSIGGSDNPFSALAGGGGNHFALSEHSPSFGLLHLNQRNSDSMIENKNLFRSQTDEDNSDGRILRPFFDDWPRSIHDNATSNGSSLTTSTSLSISVPGNPSSDFSLKLSTGDGDEPGDQERERPPLLNWGMAWGSNPVGSVGGPLAEALRSSARSNSNSSPTSVLHQLQQRGSVSEVSYVST